MLLRLLHAIAVRGLRQVSDSGLQVLFAGALRYLVEREYLCMEPQAGGAPSDTGLVVTGLGAATASSGMQVDVGHLVFHDLHRAARSLVIEHPLHLLYLVRRLGGRLAMVPAGVDD